MSYAAFAALAPTTSDAEAAMADAITGELWGVALPGALAAAAEISGEPWLLVVSEDWVDGEEDELGAAIPDDWPACSASDAGSDMLALGVQVAYLAALLGIGVQ